MADGKLTGWAHARLDELKAMHLDRSFRVVEGLRGPHVRIEGREVLNFSSNDYLGLAQHADLARAAREATDAYGWGTGASRLLAGTTRWHTEIETAIARFVGADAALFFPAGYLANLGTVPTLADDATALFSDELNHASVIDACRLSRARVVVFPHRDLERLDRELRDAREPRKIVLTDTVFSMDGDLAPLPEIVAISRRHGADLLVDDAHGFGIFGAHGRGALEHWGVEADIPVHTATLSKAAGSVGGFVCGPAPVIDFLRSRARTFIFTTAQPPALAAAGRAAVELLSRSGDARAKLWANVKRFRERLAGLGFDLRGSVAPIVPVLFGSVERTMKASARLWELGFFAPAIRPPTVPEGLSRLRVSVTALHEAEHIDALADALGNL